MTRRDCALAIVEEERCGRHALARVLDPATTPAARRAWGVVADDHARAAFDFREMLDWLTTEEETKWTPN